MKKPKLQKPGTREADQERTKVPSKMIVHSKSQREEENLKSCMILTRMEQK
jgi:hypothetical protein